MWLTIELGSSTPHLDLRKLSAKSTDGGRSMLSASSVGMHTCATSKMCAVRTRCALGVRCARCAHGVHSVCMMCTRCARFAHQIRRCAVCRMCTRCARCAHQMWRCAESVQDVHTVCKVGQSKKALRKLHELFFRCKCTQDHTSFMISH